MAGGPVLRAKGLKELILACDKAGKETKSVVRAALRSTGIQVRADATNRFARYDEKTAFGFRVIVRRRGVNVEQTLRKTTGLRPDFGALQMRRGLLPALRDNEAELERQVELALDRIVDHFNSGNVINQTEGT
jgi:predicted HTH domain antitoxin